MTRHYPYIRNIVEDPPAVLERAVDIIVSGHEDEPGLFTQREIDGAFLLGGIVTAGAGSIAIAKLVKEGFIAFDGQGLMHCPNPFGKPEPPLNLRPE